MDAGCTFTALSSVNTADPVAVQALLQSCTERLLAPSTWAFALGVTAACGAIGALVGWTKGRAGPGLVWGLVLGPIGWLVVALQPGRLPLCPECGRPNRARAKRCRNCGVDFARLARRTPRADLKASERRPGW